MKFTRSLARAASALLCTLVLASACFAATAPLNQPRGLALDASGNLYVANTLGDQVLVYSPAYQQLTAKTITQDILSPLMVAFDPTGNLWVSNMNPGNTGTEYLSHYAPNGNPIDKKYTKNANSLSYVDPALAVDGVGDLWITGANGFQTYILALNPPAGYDSDFIVDAFFFQYAPYTTVAAHGPWIAFGGATSAYWALAGAFLTNDGGLGDLPHLSSSESVPNGVVAMAFDARCNLYIAAYDGNSGGIVQTVNAPAGGAPVSVLTLNYLPSAMAADSVRKRLYITDTSNNQIHVYSTSTWTQVATIQ